MLDALLFASPPALLRAVYSDCVWRVPGNEPVLYLTFDDGPTPGVTDKVLQLLRQWNAKATFFCIGKNIEENPTLFNHILSSGHAVGNHTQQHVNGWRTPHADYMENILQCEEVLNTHGAKNISKLFRPPYGKLTLPQYRALKKDCCIVMWDVLTCDYSPSVSEEEVLANTLRYATSGSVVVFHDSLKAADKMLYALPKVLKHFSEQGYKFEAL